MGSTGPVPRRVRFGPFELDLHTDQLWNGSTRLKVPGQSIQILEALLERPGDLVTREQLRDRLWPSDTFVDYAHGLNAAVRRLREALGDAADTPRYIETLPRRGYRFIAPTAPVEDLAAPVLHPDPAAEPPLAAELDGPVPESSSGPGELERGPVAPSGTTSAAGPEVEQGPGWQRFRSPFTVLGAVFTVTAAAAVWLAWSMALPHADPRPIRSIAVLPLENLSADPDQEYFADGMTEAIISRLAAIRGLRVISRTSVTQFKETRQSVPDIAEALNVEAVVVGSVLRSGDRVRITAQLIDARERETNLWSDTFEGDVGDVLALQARVAESISTRVALTLSGGEKQLLTASRRVAPDVYEHYLRGQFALTRPDRSAVRDAMTHFEAALALDPTFAPAYAGLSRVYRELGTNFRGASPQSEVLPKAIAAAERAVELDPTLAEAHLLIAAGRTREWRWDAAETGFRHALRLEPNNAAAHIGLAHLLAARGRLDEAVQLAQVARTLDPLSAQTAANVGWTFYFARRYADAIRACQASLDLKPDNHSGLWYLGISLKEAGRFDEAIEVLEHAAVISERSPGLLGSLVNAYGRAGRRAEALRTLDELTRRRQTMYVPAGAFVHAYAGLGDREQAFAWLERAYDERSNVMWQLNVAPTLDPLRSDARFTELLRRVGLD